jgi:hypothetical protein
MGLISRWRRLLTERGESRKAKKIGRSFLQKDGRYYSAKHGLLALADEESRVFAGLVKRRKIAKAAKRLRNEIQERRPSDLFLRKRLLKLRQRAHIGIRRLRKGVVDIPKFRVAVLAESMIETHLYFGLTARNPSDVFMLDRLNKLLPNLNLSFRPRLHMRMSEIRSPTPGEKEALYLQLEPILSSRLSPKKIREFVTVFYKMYVLICRDLAVIEKKK